MVRRTELLTKSTIQSLLREIASTRPDTVALTGLEGEPSTYADLLSQVENTATWLSSSSISHGDKVVTVVPDSPEMAALFLGVSSVAACAPLNPRYRTTDFERYLPDLNPKLVIVDSATESPIRDMARSTGIPVVELRRGSETAAGRFNLGEPFQSVSRSKIDYSTSDDVALVLHTSGTTSRPKMVPLTQANLCTSALNIAQSLELTAADRCLNIMPLFHVHGLIGAVLSSLAVGASVVCTPGFRATEFFDWLDQFEPTWYTGVPTMHQAILSRVSENRECIEQARLRMIRSCSSALSPQTLAELEQTFGVPAIEAYGMTEASHQMASSPLPPGKRKPGSVGMPTGIDLAILDETGKVLAAEEVGEIGIRGPNVTKGYENNPEANQNSFVNGWFRTGDQGRLDVDGYLWITGRVKELIVRGGEKIAPREIDELLLTHPAVAQALAFAIPDQALGEEVGAAVVLKPGVSVSEMQLCEYMAERIVDFKVPRRIVFLESLPLGPTGKPQRIGLASKLGIDSTKPKEMKQGSLAPRNETERRVADIWREVLRRPTLGVLDNFFDLGGDSILAVQLTNRLAREFEVKISVPRLIQLATVAEIASWIDGLSSTNHEFSKTAGVI